MLFFNKKILKKIYRTYYERNKKVKSEKYKNNVKVEPKYL